MNANKQIIYTSKLMLGHRAYQKAITDYINNHLNIYLSSVLRYQEQKDIRLCDFYDGCAYALKAIRDFQEREDIKYSQTIDVQIINKSEEE